MTAMNDQHGFVARGRDASIQPMLPAGGVTRMNHLGAVTELMRPHQWAKNLFVFLPVFFGGRMLDPDSVVPASVAFMILSITASAIYTLNDVLDVRSDQAHPVKRHRPVASGRISGITASAWGVAFAVVGLGGAALLLADTRVLWLVSVYAGLNVLYSVSLKHLPIIDVSCIASGFVLRVVLGGVVSGVHVSPWLIIMTFLLAMFLALGKRFDDLAILAQLKNGQTVRPALDGYNAGFVSSAMTLMAGVNVVCYLMYTTSPTVVGYYGTELVYLTAFWVVLGLLRYLQVSFVDQRSGSPTQVLLKDRAIQAILGAWIVHFAVLLQNAP
jgi:4-hydroxybenzoate polyprenyltransferase